MVQISPNVYTAQWSRYQQTFTPCNSSTINKHSHHVRCKYQQTGGSPASSLQGTWFPTVLSERILLAYVPLRGTTKRKRSLEEMMQGNRRPEDTTKRKRPLEETMQGIAIRDINKKRRQV